MTLAPTPELFWLTMTCVLTALLWIPYIVQRIIEHGLLTALKNPERDARPKSPWADRLMWAHANAVENLVVLAPLVLVAASLEANSTATATASLSYFFARLVHVVVYSLGIPVVRTVAFFVGFCAQMTFALAIFQAL